MEINHFAFLISVHNTRHLTPTPRLKHFKGELFNIKTEPVIQTINHSYSFCKSSYWHAERNDYRMVNKKIYDDVMIPCTMNPFELSHNKTSIRLTKDHSVKEFVVSRGRILSDEIRYTSHLPVNNGFRNFYIIL